MAQDTGKAKGVPAFADASADKVTEADRTCNIVFAYGYALLDHSHRFPANTVVASVKGIFIGVHL